MTTYTVDNFPYKKLTLGKPNPLQGGGSYFTKMSIDDKPIYIQFPKCETKNGVVETKRQKYIDMMFNRENETSLSEWAESLENQCQELINIKKDIWFSNEITREDLESMMSPISRVYKSGTKLLIRSYIDLDKKTNEPICRIYDEKEIIRMLSDIQLNTKIIPLIHLEGIKFTSRSFDIELRIIQILILDEREQTTPSLFCLIKENKSLNNVVNLEKPAQLTQENVTSRSMEMSKDESKDESSDLIDEHNNISDDQINNNLEKHIQDSSEGDIELNCIEELPVLNKSKNKSLEEVTLDVSDEEPIKLKNKNEVYYEIYHAALKKAKHMRNVAIQAFLEAKEIKTKYMLSDLDDSDEEFEDSSFYE